jgi:hypothetical protein
VLDAVRLLPGADIGGDHRPDLLMERDAGDAVGWESRPTVALARSLCL